MVPAALAAVAAVELEAVPSSSALRRRDDRGEECTRGRLEGERVVDNRDNGLVAGTARGGVLLAFETRATRRGPAVCASGTGTPKAGRATAS